MQSSSDAFTISSGPGRLQKDQYNLFEHQRSTSSHKQLNCEELLHHPHTNVHSSLTWNLLFKVKAHVIQSSSVKWHQLPRGCHLGLPRTSCIMTEYTGALHHRFRVFIHQSGKHRKIWEAQENKALLEGCLTQFTVVIHQNNFMKKVCRGTIQDTMDRAKQGRKCFIVETDNNAGRWQVRRVGLLSTSVNRNRGVSCSGISTRLGHYWNFINKKQALNGQEGPLAGTKRAWAYNLCSGT